MSIAELRIALALDATAWSLTLRAESKRSGEFDSGPTTLPFSESDLALFERALDLNKGEDLKRTFDARAIARLNQLGLLRPPPDPLDAAELSGGDLHLQQLREHVRGWLAAVLLKPLQAVIEQHFAALRESNQGESNPGQRPRPLLNLRLEFRPDKDLPLLRLPWELLHQYRFPNGEVQLCRYLRYPAVPGLPAGADALQILLLESEPEDDELTALDLQEHQQISAGLKAGRHARLFSIQNIAPASYKALQDALWDRRGQPLILHFAGHGDFGWRCEQCDRITDNNETNPCGKAECGFQRHGEPSGYLAFTGGYFGSANWVGISGLRNLLNKADVRLLVLNACKTATARAGSDVFNGMAQQLMDIVPAIIATPYPLETEAAEEFSRLLYRGLAEGLSLVEAMHQTQQEMAEPWPEEWYRPVLYLRSVQEDGGRLLNVHEASPERPVNAGGTTLGADSSPVPTRLVGGMGTTLRKALHQLAEQHEAAIAQSVNAVDAVARTQASAQAIDIERRMIELQTKLDRLGLEHD